MSLGFHDLLRFSWSISQSSSAEYNLFSSTISLKELFFKNVSMLYFKSYLYRIKISIKIYEFAKKEITLEGDNWDYKLTRQNDVLESNWAPDCASLTLFCDIFDSFIKPKPATFNKPPVSSKIFLAPYKTSNNQEQYITPMRAN